MTKASTTKPGIGRDPDVAPDMDDAEEVDDQPWLGPDEAPELRED